MVQRLARLNLVLGEESAMQAPILNQLERRKKIAEVFRGVLSARGISNAFEEQGITITERTIVESTGGQKKLSNAILDYMFPKEPSPCDLFHYTSASALKDIAASGELRLYALRRHIDEGELKTFATKHTLAGYLDGSRGEEYYRELSDDIFYTSFTRLGAKSTADMWAFFAEGGRGVRLKFRLAPRAADLRSIQYEQPCRTLLNELHDALSAAGEPPFVPWQISRIGGFYLPSTLAYEDEIRLMVKRHKDDRNDARRDGNDEYWPIPISTDNDFCRIDLIEIGLGPDANHADIEAVISNSSLSTVPIIHP